MSRSVKALYLTGPYTTVIVNHTLQVAPFTNRFSDLERDEFVEASHASRSPKLNLQAVQDEILTESIILITSSGHPMDWLTVF